MKVTLGYGSSTMTAICPDEWQMNELLPTVTTALKNPSEVLEQALDAPVGTTPFNEVFKNKKSVCIIVPDKTRRAGVDILLPTVLKRLYKLGIKEKNITIVFATGIHPGQTEMEQKAIVGGGIHQQFTCVDHNANGDDLVVKGMLGGKPFFLNRHVANADGIIVLGGVKPHYLAGFGGGRKAIMPGVSSRQNCFDFHKLCLNDNGPGRHPRIGTAKLDGNPMHHRAIEAAKLAGVDFLINTVVDPDGQITFLNAGDLEGSYLEAAETARRVDLAPLKEKADVVIASCGGYPADINVIQVHKALDSACAAAKPGGYVILLAECRDGIGNDSFIKWFDLPDVAAMDKELRRNFIINGQTAMALREKSAAFRVFFVSSLPPETVVRMGMAPVPDLQTAVDIVADRAGNKSNVLFIKKAGSLFPDV